MSRSSTSSDGEQAGTEPGVGLEATARVAVDGGWARAGDPHADLAVYQERLSVALIATTRSDFEVCRRDEKIGTVLSRVREDFDYLPVQEELGDQGRIIGILPLEELRSAAHRNTRATRWMQPLSETWLIGAEGSILSFVLDADSRPFRLVVGSGAIEGLVTLSDLQRLPVRAALFATIMQLEMAMTEIIRRHWGETADWLELLPPGKSTKLQNAIEAARAGDTFVDALLLTLFDDKVTVLQKLWASAGEPSFAADMKAAYRLRNDLAHARGYADTREKASTLCETVRKMNHWLSKMRGGSLS